MESEDFLLRAYTKGHRRLSAAPRTQFAACNRIRKAGGACRRECGSGGFLIRKSRCAGFQHPFHHQTAQRVKWSASGATKKADMRRVIFNKHENTPKPESFRIFFVQ